MRYCADEELRLPTVNYDDPNSSFVGGQSFTIRGDQFGEMDGTLKETKFFRYFLDGSRRTYKIDDIEINRRIYPIIAGQIGVACCERKSANEFGNAELENSLILSLPIVSNPHSKNSTEFFASLANKINQTPRLKSINLSFSKILTYSSAVVIQMFGVRT